jgi:peptidylprolyl isomerase
MKIRLMKIRLVVICVALALCGAGCNSDKPAESAANPPTAQTAAPTNTNLPTVQAKSPPATPPGSADTTQSTAATGTAGDTAHNAPTADKAGASTPQPGKATDSGAQKGGKIVKTASGLEIEDIKVGTGPLPKPGQTVTVDYIGSLSDGTQFDSSFDHGQPFQFVLGEGKVIRGWDEGVATMHVGGKRILTVPPDLGYGAQGAGDKIPPNATLTFIIDLHSAQ